MAIFESIMGATMIASSAVDMITRPINYKRSLRNNVRDAKVQKLENSKSNDITGHRIIDNITNEQNKAIDNKINKINKEREVLF